MHEQFEFCGEIYTTNLRNYMAYRVADIVEAKIRADERRKVFDELCNNTIENIEEIKKWYIDVCKETDTNNVPIRTILYDLDKLIERLKEQKK